MSKAIVEPPLGALLQDARQDLQTWGVIISDTQTATWQDAELTFVRDAYKQAPDKNLLRGLAIVREKAHANSPNSVEAETHGPNVPCAAQPPGKIHTHFYDLAFGKAS